MQYNKSILLQETHVIIYVTYYKSWKLFESFFQVIVKIILKLSRNRVLSQVYLFTSHLSFNYRRLKLEFNFHDTQDGVLEGTYAIN